jgi:predicted permease
MISESFEVLLPLFLLIAGGYLLSWWFSISETSLVRSVTDFFMPLLVFSSLYSSTIEVRQTLQLCGAVSFVLVFLLVASIIYCRVFKQDARGFIPPIIFMNSGFFGVALMQVWSGAEAVNQIIIYDQIQTLYIFTAGIFVVTGGFAFSGLLEIFKTPLMWAIALGFWCRHAGVEVPPSLLGAMQYAGAGGPALATFALGCSLRKTSLRFSPHLISGLLMRFGLGLVAGVLAVHIFDITGIAKSVVIIASGLPSAVFAVVLPVRYGVDASFAGGMVLLSTLLSVFALPVMFYLAGLV